MFLGHLSIKGASADNRNLMTSIVVHPRLWEPTPYVLFEETAFGDAYDHSTPMSINIRALRDEARRDAEVASGFWGARRANVMVNIEGWPIQYDAAWDKPRAGASRAAYNAKAIAVHTAIQDGIEQGWPEIDRFGWWARVLTPRGVELRDLDLDVDRLNLESAPVMRRASYFASHIYPFRRLVADDVKPGVDQAHARDWVQPVHDAVEAMMHLRDALGGRQLVLPCMYGTRMGWRGRYKEQLLTEAERRLLIRASFEAGADGILVWQPIRSERERDEFQVAITQIESELARINGLSDPGPTMTLGELWGITNDWPGRAMGWMTKTDRKPSAPAPVSPDGR